MRVFALALELSLLISGLLAGSSGWTESPRTLHFRDGVDVAFAFAAGPAASRDGRFESVAEVRILYGSRDAHRVRGVVFDATRSRGEYTHALSNTHPPTCAPQGPPDGWQVRNIFFTMDRRWEGKLTLRFDDGTAETQRFSFSVDPR